MRILLGNGVEGPGYVEISNAIGYYDFNFSKYLLADVLYGPPHAIISLICVLCTIGIATLG